MKTPYPRFWKSIALCGLFSLALACSPTTPARNQPDYDGTKNGALYLLKTSGDQITTLTTDSLQILMKACADFRKDPEVTAGCSEFLRRATSASRDPGLQKMAQRARASFTLLIRSPKGAELCGPELREMANDVAGDEPLLRGIRSICSGDQGRAEAALVEAAQDSSKTNSINENAKLAAESLLIALAGKDQSGLYQQGMRALLDFRYEQLETLLKDAPASATASILSAELINPFNGVSPFARDKAHLRMEDFLNRAAAEIGMCSSAGCRILQAHVDRLRAEIAYTRGEQGKAAMFWQRCRGAFPEWKNFASWISNCSQDPNGQAAAQAKPDRADKIFTVFAPKVEAKSDSALALRVRMIAKRMVETPYLRGRFPFELDIYAANYANAEAQFRDGKGVIIIGEGLVSDLSRALGEGKLRADTDLDSVLAVIIGHELHHLAAGHGKESCSILESEDAYGMKRSTDRAGYALEESRRVENWRREYEADEMGMLYAFMAGYRAQSFLSVLEFSRRGTVSESDLADHPSAGARIKNLVRRIKTLQSASFQFEESVRQIRQADAIVTQGSVACFRGDDRVCQTYVQRAYPLLRSANERMKSFETAIPGHPSVAINRGYTLLRAAMLRDRMPELPLQPLFESVPGFVPPIGGVSVHGLSGDRPIFPILRYRPSLAENPFAAAGPDLQQAVDLLEPAIARYPGEGALYHNLGLARYLMAHRLIRQAWAANAPIQTAQRTAILANLTRAREAFMNARARLPKEDVLERLHLAAVEIQRIHVTGEVGGRICDNENCNSSLGRIAFLIARDPRQALSYPPPHSILLRDAESAAAFILPYALTIELGTLTDIDQKEAAVTRGHIQELLAHTSAPGHWHSELEQMEAVLKRSLDTASRE